MGTSNRQSSYALTWATSRGPKHHRLAAKSAYNRVGRRPRKAGSWCRSGGLRPRGLWKLAEPMKRPKSPPEGAEVPKRPDGLCHRDQKEGGHLIQIAWKLLGGA